MCVCIEIPEMHHYCEDRKLNANRYFKAAAAAVNSGFSQLVNLDCTSGIISLFKVEYDTFSPFIPLILSRFRSVLRRGILFCQNLQSAKIEQELPREPRNIFDSSLLRAEATITKYNY